MPVQMSASAKNAIQQLTRARDEMKQHVVNNQAGIDRANSEIARLNAEIESIREEEADRFGVTVEEVKVPVIDAKSGRVEWLSDAEDAAEKKAVEDAKKKAVEDAKPKPAPKPV